MKIEYTLKDFDGNKIKNKFGLGHEGNSRLYLSNRAFIRMQKYVPRDTGALSTTVTIKPRSVTYEQPYAHAQYVGYTNGEVTHYNTPGTGTYWDRRMWSAEGNLLTREVEKYMKHLKDMKG